ncbi:MAG: hypothetical protein ACK5HY_07425 [Parahaliea sp.]
MSVFVGAWSGRALLLWLVAALAANAATQTGAPYGERLLRSGETAADALDDGAGLPVAVAGYTVDPAYAAQLEAQQRGGGPYNPALTETLEALARGRQLQGDSAGAEALYSRALHVLRVNEGLHSERQLPVLQTLIALSRQRGDLEALDDRYDYLYFLQNGGLTPADAAELQQRLNYFRWQREALRLGLDAGRGLRRLLQLFDENEDLLEQLSVSDGAFDTGQRWLVVESQLRNFYLLQSLLPEPPDLRTQMTVHAHVMRPTAELDPQYQRLEQQRRNGMLQGAQWIQDFIDSLPEGDPAAWSARLALGDWFQWHGHSRRAATLYRDLYRDLEAAGEQEHLARWFGEARELPDNGVFFQPLAAGESAAGPVTLRFRISAGGRVQEVETVAVPSDAHKVLTNLRRELYAMWFRPRFDASGEAVASVVERGYEWLPLRRSR